MRANGSSAESRGQRVRPCIPAFTIRSKVWIEVDGTFAIGEGGLELLAAIDTDGSLASGARTVGWSYRHAWGYLRRAERVLGIGLLETRNGKGSQRGTTLTPVARRLLTQLSAHARQVRRIQSLIPKSS